MFPVELFYASFVIKTVAANGRCRSCQAEAGLLRMIYTLARGTALRNGGNRI